MAIQTSTLRPGLLVSVKTSVKGNVDYNKIEIEPDHATETGERKARWETTRIITDPVEFEASGKVRSKARGLIRSICTDSAFGLLCPESKADQLEAAMAEARKLVDAFNAGAKLTRVSVYIMTGRIAADDVEAVKAINSEVRDLLDEMAEGIQELDVTRVRAAATKAKSVGAMLTLDAQARLQVAIETVRAQARKIVAAGEAAAVEIDKDTLARLKEARTSFLDLDDAGEVAISTPTVAAVDFSPAADDGEITVEPTIIGIEI